MIKASNFSSCFKSTIAMVIAISMLPVASYAQVMIEEITVTARKKEESLMKTPLAVTAISAQDIKDS
ncbi:MAG: hypothetical protein HOM10_06300, partial [Gammaproteobacteria bacterium]|nr:hypothetical protein [Gammaproteobacteria bacterium]